ncbi:MAG: HAD-IC family P-type ATPase, partial [Burkholderiaceae bacterium]
PVLPFLRHFWGLSAWMLELIALLSYVRRKQADFRVAIALLVVNAILGFVQEQRAAAAVELLRRRLDVQARALRDGHWSAVAARSLVKGDLVRVRAGDFVPADMQVIDGEAKIDQSALTGESQEVARRVDETLYSGSTVREGEATAVVTVTDVAKGAASVPCVASRYGADGGAVRGRVRGGVLVGLYGLDELGPMPLGQIVLLYGCAAALVFGPDDWVKVVMIRRVGSA